MLSPLETALIALLLVVLMFGMGATLTWERFQAVAREPKAFLIGTASQFGWMPLLAYGLAKGLSLPPLAALGLVVMGTCPGGTTSNLFAHLAKADVALSIAMTAASKVLGIVMMPICLYLYARPFTEANMPIPYSDVIKTLIVLLVPVAVAMLLRRRYGERFAHVAERIGSSSGMVLLIALIGISVVRNRALFSTLTLPMCVAAVALGLFGMLAGALVARAAGLTTAQRRTVSFETGVQNSPLCFAILVAAFPGESQLELLKLPLLYALFVLIEAALATTVYRWLDGRALTLAHVRQAASTPIASCLAIVLTASSLSACSDDTTPAAMQKPETTGSSDPSGGSSTSVSGASSGSSVTPTSSSGASDAGSAASSGNSDASTTNAEAPLPTVTGTVTYFQDVKPFMDAKCVRCHVAGTVAPFSLDTYDLAKEHGTIARAAIMAGTMPPWLFADGCNDYKGNFSLTAQEKATFYAWVDQGMPQGDPAKPGAKLDIGEVGLSRVDVSLQIPEMYTSKQLPDEYRCFPVPWPSKYTTDTFMTGYRAVPGNPRVVHHVEVYYIPKAQVQTVMSKDSADPGPGYTCFGGPGAGNGTVGGWAPGSPGYDYPPNVGIKIEAGSVMVIQVHYNTQAAGQAEPDQTKVEFKVDDNVVEGGYDFWMNYAWSSGGLNIPAGKADVGFDWSADPTSLNGGSMFGGGSGKAIKIYTAAIHMHNLGTTGFMHLKRKDGTRQCIVELKKWDFHWQGGVRLQNPILVNPGDVIEMECRYDNSQANQPVYQGKQQTPRNVNWGENTTDEMCLGVLLWGQP
jgi:bile acid transporter